MTADQRLTVAGRIAAVTIFSNKYAVWTDDLGAFPDDDASVRDLCGGTEKTSGNLFECNEAAVRETLATGLFSARGPDRFGWAHQTYAEFLAAWYLDQHGIDLSQMLSLFRHPKDASGKLIPQLHETAAWLAGMSIDVFRKIRDIEPEVLLRSDVASADVADRETLVSTLLNLYEAEVLLDSYVIRTQYRKLDHPGLAGQLRPYITDRARGPICRRVAADIAEACNVTELQNDLADVALDRSDLYGIRVNAAHAVLRMGDEHTRTKLKPLTECDIAEDPDQELKGCALQAIWPHSLGTKEFFKLLKPVHNETYSGSYEYFLRYELVKKMTPGGVPVALRWVESQPNRRDLSYDCRCLIDEIMLKGWDHLESNGVIEAFARAVWSRLLCSDQIVSERDVAWRFGSDSPSLREQARLDQKKRREVLESLLSLVTDRKDFLWLTSSSNVFISSLDLEWMTEQLQSANEAQHAAFARMISRALDYTDVEQVNVAYRAAQQSPVVANELRWLFRSVDLASEEAKTMREEHAENLKFEQQVKNPPLLSPPPSERIVALLGACEKGEPILWWKICRYLQLEPVTTHWGDEHQADVTKLPGWRAADEATKQRLIVVARDYLLNCGDDTSRWIEDDSTVFLDSWGGYKALVLLLKEAPSELAKLSAERWSAWLPVTLTFPLRDGDHQANQNLVRLADQTSREGLIAATITLLDHDRCPLHRVECCWSLGLVDSLNTKLSEKHLKPPTVSHILTHLLDHSVAEARAFAEDQIITLEPRLEDQPEQPTQDLNWLTTSLLEEINDERERRIVAGKVLATHGGTQGWRAVWTKILSDDSFGHDIIGRIAQDEFRAKRLLRELPESTMADLFLWLVRRYPYSNSGSSNVYFGELTGGPGPFRNAVLVELRQRGTVDACAAIQRISDECPELDWMKWHLLEAWDITRRKTWIPPTPKDIVSLMSDGEHRLVQSADQLMNVVLESLTRLQTRLHGETPAVTDLWNDLPQNPEDSQRPKQSKLGRAHRPRRILQPRDEHHFADYVKRELERDLTEKGVVINREVQIHRGERTDIHVNAVIRLGTALDDKFDKATVIIETKGCWNRDLDHSMSTQLVERYLKDNQCQHGLYLVGWFNCDLWYEGDYRKAHAPRLTFEEAQQRYRDQAAELSVGGISVAAFVLDAALH